MNSDVVKRGINGVVVPGRKRRKVFRIKTNNRLRGSYGETDLDKETIEINKKKHKTNPTHKKKYPEILDTKLHEMEHAKHPKKTEKAIRREIPKRIKRMSKKLKGRIYRKDTITVNNSYQYK